MNKILKSLPYYWVTLIVIALDQITKFLIRSSLNLGEIIELTPKLIWLTYVQNTGAAFSFSFGSPLLNRVLFIILSLLATIFIVFLSVKSKNKFEIFSFALILGGAIGNLIDRIFLGSVTDFIWCDFPDIIMTRWPVFNVADSSIVIAIILMLITTFFHAKTNEENK